MLKKSLYIVFIFICNLTVLAQSFAPQVGFEGNTAIHKDSIVFVDWAKEISVQRGYKSIENPDLGLVDYGEESNALNQADGNPNIISLGDGGIAILQFNHPISNGIGPDFAVFENGFLKEPNSDLAFLELAFVEVSTDGVEYIRFAAISETPSDNQMDSFGFMDGRYLHNLAGKYVNNYGTPFDLNDLIGLTENTTVDLNQINYVKIIDVVGSIQAEYATYDSLNNVVNDPFPTAFASGGFDLDAVGVIHNSENTQPDNTIFVYPNPFTDYIHIQTQNQTIYAISLFSVTGKHILFTENSNFLDASNLQKGIYLLAVKTKNKTFYFKIIKS